MRFGLYFLVGALCLFVGSVIADDNPPPAQAPAVPPEVTTTAAPPANPPAATPAPPAQPPANTPAAPPAPNPPASQPPPQGNGTSSPAVPPTTRPTGATTVKPPTTPQPAEHLAPAAQRLEELVNSLPKGPDGKPLKGKALMIKRGYKLFAYKNKKNASDVEEVSKLIMDGRPKVAQQLKQQQDQLYSQRKAAVDQAMEHTKKLKPKPLPDDIPLTYVQINTATGLGEVLVEGDISLSAKDARRRFPPAPVAPAPKPAVATMRPNPNATTTPISTTAQPAASTTTVPARAKRQAQYDSQYPDDIWNDGVYYNLASNLNQKARQAIQQAIAFFQQNTCIRFKAVNPNNSPSYPVITFFPGDGCYSPVGREVGAEIQYVSIGSQCEDIITVAHEIGHSLGLFHEQNRYERNNYVYIDANNIEDGYAADYQAQTSSTNFNYGKPYEYRGMMHYNPNAWAKDPSKPVITAFTSAYQMSIGGSGLPVFGDIAELNLLYSCYDKCDSSNITCAYGGYPNPNNCGVCQCPRGFGGKDCSQRQAPTAGLKCGANLQATTSWQYLKVNNAVGHGLNSTSVNLQNSAHCTWFITAPPGSRIQYMVNYVGFEGNNDALCYDYCYYGGLNLKGMETSWKSEGMRFCCAAQYNVAMSTASRLLVVQPWNLYKYTDFQLQYKIDALDLFFLAIYVMFFGIVVVVVSFFFYQLSMRLKYKIGQLEIDGLPYDDELPSIVTEGKRSFVC
ncbi:hypothetical protein QR680_016271 [Steinernema hermaphroditum]|uniref:Metalloendopeptidase n=1 Tax=Steinernema hermaphroditum TaxID=289476 RepID=A0AA39HAN1_9BILA|nr:hypothetical protein QR680_016271 [Steinernema hermaphroditum]